MVTAGFVALMTAATPKPATAATPKPYIVVGAESPPFAPYYGTSGGGGPISLACGATTCLAEWDGQAMPLGADGRPSALVPFLTGDYGTGETAVTWAGDHFLLAVSSEAGVGVMRVAADGVPGSVTYPEPSATGSDSEPALVWNAGHTLLAWYDSTGPVLTPTTELWSVMLDDQLAPTGAPVELDPNVTAAQGHSLQVYALNDGFAIVGGLNMYVLDGNGVLTAGPILLPGTKATDTVYGVSATPVGTGLALAFVTGAVASRLLMLDASLQSTVTANNPAGKLSPAALGWNGTTLVYMAEGSGIAPAAYRYTSSLTSAGGGVSLAALTASLDAAAVAATGSGFIAVASGYDNTNSDMKGVYAMPLDATGKPAAGAVPTLLSNSVRPEASPAVAASAGGFIAAVSADLALELGSLTADGLSDTTKGLVAITAPYYGRAAPQDVATGPSGSIMLWGSSPLYFSFYGANGTLGDAQPFQSAGVSVINGSNAAASWNGSAWTVVAGGYLESNTIAADGTVGTSAYASPYAGNPQGNADRVALSTLGGTTLLAWSIDYDLGGQAIANHVFLERLDGEQAMGDPSEVPSPTYPGTWPSTSLSLANDGNATSGGFLAAWDELDNALDGSYTSEVRVIRAGLDGLLRDTAPLSLFKVQGAPPDDAGNATVPLHDVGAAFDGTAYWIVWRMDSGAWARRVSVGAQAIDAAPVQLVSGEITDVRISSRGDGRVLLLYVRNDPSPGIRADRVESRMLTSADMPQTTGTGGGGGGAGTGGTAGPGSGGAGGGPGPGGGGGAGGGGGVTGHGGAGGAAASGNGGGAGPGSGGAGGGATGPDAGTGNSGGGGAAPSSGGCSCAIEGAGGAMGRRDRGAGLALFALAALVATRGRRRPAHRARHASPRRGVHPTALLAFVLALALQAGGCSSGGTGAASGGASGAGDKGGTAASGSGGTAAGGQGGPAGAGGQTGAGTGGSGASGGASSGGAAGDANGGASGAGGKGGAAGAGGGAAGANGTAGAGGAAGAGQGGAAGGAPANPLHAKAVVGGAYHTCALIDDGRVKCFGDGENGELCNGTYATFGADRDHSGDNMLYAQLGTGRTATVLAAHNETTCAILDDATLKCWGDNLYAQLGQESYANNLGSTSFTIGDSLPPIKLGTGRTARAVAVGEQHVCAVLDNGQLKCWGSGGGTDWSALGYGDTMTRGLPGSMGDNLPAVNLGTGRTATAVACGLGHTCAILDNACVKCWGLNTSGELGQENTNNLGDAPGEMGDNLPCIDLGAGSAKPKALSAGWGSTCALFDNGRIKCWGSNAAGQLGLEDQTNRGDAPGEMGTALPYVDLGIGRTVTAISVAAYQVCAVLDDGDVKCWGGNAFAELGTGDGAPRGSTPGDMGDALLPINLGTGLHGTTVGTTYTSSCAVLSNMRLKCWGEGGQLGDALDITLGDRPTEMGDNLPYADLGNY